MKKILAVILIAAVCCVQTIPVAAAREIIYHTETEETPAEQGETGPEIASPSAILMEASTGQVIYE